MSNKVSIVSLIISILVSLGVTMSAEAGVIFEDNFDNYGDWSSTTEYGTSFGDKTSAPFNLTADFSKAAWAHYRHARTANQVGYPVWAVTQESAHSGTRSLKYELENTYFDWNGGGMTLYLGGPDNSVSGEKELYISAWIRFEDNFIVPYLSDGHMMKLMRVYYGVNADLEKGFLSSEVDYNGNRRLETFLKIVGNNYMRFDVTQFPNYRAPSGTPWGFVNRVQADYNTYKNWTRVMYHIKLNSAGNTDGALELYVGDTKVASIDNVMLVNTSSEGSIENNKVNSITVPDNYFQTAYGIPGYSTPDNPVATNPGEVAFYIDDLVISTNYVPLDYVIGGLRGDVNGDGVVDILDLQACVNVFLGTETRPDFIQRAKQVAEPLDECNVLDVQAIVNVILGV